MNRLRSWINLLSSEVRESVKDTEIAIGQLRRIIRPSAGAEDETLKDLGELKKRIFSVEKVVLSFLIETTNTSGRSGLDPQRFPIGTLLKVLAPPGQHNLRIITVPKRSLDISSSSSRSSTRST